MKIQSVAILGAGAVGCYVLWGLADKAAANTLQLGVVAEGSRAERLRQNGCTINGQVYHPQVWTPQQAHGVGVHGPEAVQQAYRHPARWTASAPL